MKYKSMFGTVCRLTAKDDTIYDNYVVRYYCSSYTIKRISIVC